MAEITIILILLHYIGLFIFKPKMDQFNCGIFGYSGNKFNKYKFNILGLYNDARGGDSCGIAISNSDVKTIKYGHDKTRLFKHFIESGENIDGRDVKFAFGHCRKASVGGIGLPQAQPVVIRDENENPIFIMIHNGTLLNYKELALKYEVEYAITETDSQIFAKIVHKAGYRVFGEYEGAGAFMCWSAGDGENTIRVFKGASLYYSNNNDIYIERPLFSISDGNSMWISSMPESLSFINDRDIKIEEVPHNRLVTIKNGVVIASEYIDRSKMKQVSILTWDTTKGWNGYKNQEFKEGKDFLPKKNTDIVVFSDIIRGTNNHAGGKVYYEKNGLYYINGQPCHGGYKLSQVGYVFDRSQFNEVYFYKGVIMLSYFDWLCAEAASEQELQATGEELDPIYLSSYSPHPTPLLPAKFDPEEAIDFYIYNEKKKLHEEFTGYFSPFFTFGTDTYSVFSGVIYSCTSTSGSNPYVQDEASLHFDKQIKEGHFSDEEMLDLINSNLLYE